MLQVSADVGPAPERTSLSTGEYLESWLSQVRGRVRGRTYAGYAGLLRRYAIPLIGAIPLTELHPLHLQRAYGTLLEHGAGGYRMEPRPGCYCQMKAPCHRTGAGRASLALTSVLAVRRSQRDPHDFSPPRRHDVRLTSYSRRSTHNPGLRPQSLQ